MLWRFRREILFVLGLCISLFVINRNYIRVPHINENEGNLAEQRINYQELIEENKRLREILDIKTDRDYLKRFTVGEVVSIKPFVFPAELVVNKGKRDGLKENMTVLSRELFLIGRISSTGEDSSTVMTVFNLRSRVSVVIEETGEIGILVGGGAPYLSLKYIPVDSKVRKGDKVLTSNYSDFYPMGIEVGRVIKAEKVPDSLFLDVAVKPSGCFSCIYEVLVGE